VERSRALAVVFVLAVATLAACASARIATTNGALVSSSLSAPAAASSVPNPTDQSPLPNPAFSAPPGQHLRVTVAQGCPKTMPWAITDVENPSDAALTKELAPSGATSGVICRYATDDQIHFSPGANTEIDSAPPLPVPNLRASTTLTPPQAGSLAAVASATSIAPVVGTYSCPSGEFGHVALIVLGYPNRVDVDLWYSDTSCQHIDNGFVSGFQGSSESFGNLQDAIDGLVPRPSEGPAT
jgi:hypothetical protein